MNYTFLLAVCDLSLPLLLAGMLIPAILGYLLRHFMGGKSNASANVDAGIDWSGKYASLEADYKGLQSKLSASAGASANAGNLEGQVKKLKDQLGSYEGDMNKLRADLKAANAKLTEFDGVDVMALKHRISGLEGEKIKLQNSLQEISGSAGEAQDAAAQAKALADRLSLLENENASLKSDLTRVTNEKNAIVRSDESVARYKEDVRELSGKVGALTIANEQLKKDLAAAGNNIAAAPEAAAPVAAIIDNSEELNQLKADWATDKAAQEAKIAALNAAVENANSNAGNAAQMQADLNAANEKLKAAEMDLSSLKVKMELADKAAPAEKIVEKIVEVEKTIEVSSAADTARIAELQTALAAAQVATPTTVEKIVEVEKVVEVSSTADKARIAELEAALAAASAASSAPTVAAVAAAPVASDDLLVIEGIGPKVNELFTAQGVTTYAQLADMSGEQVAAVLETGGNRFRILNGNSWPKQAALLRDGKTDEFNAYSDYLIAGVDPNEVKGAAADVIPDDLKIVEGIGPKIEQLLNADGIYTFKQLADSTYSQLKDVLDNAGPRYQIHDPSSWADQAALARDGKMEQLKTLQDNLKGGRE